MTISPIGDPACAEPGSEVYNYEEQKIYGYYAAVGSIRSLLPTEGTGYSSSFLFSLDSASSNDLTLAFTSATTDPAAKAAAETVAACTGTVTVTGGKVAAAGTVPADATNCPDGSVYDDAQYCLPCPTGSYCATGVNNQCAEGELS